MSRKRSSSDSDGSVERIPNKVQKYWDPYCWICHRKDTNQGCSTCNLSYHFQCIGHSGPKIKNYKCDLCIRLSEAKEDYAKRNVDKKLFHKMLGSVVDRMLSDKNFVRLKTIDEREPLDGGPSLINPFDLDIVSEKIEDKKYKSTVDFLKDIRQIRHNAEVVSTDGMKRLQISRQLEQWCAKVMYDIEICGQCFIRAMDMTDWFTEVCDPPHLLVWARVEGYPFWPAKVIGILTTANRLDVRFFGDHDMANVAAQDCLLYPSKNPNRHINPSVEKEFKASIKEAQEYIQKIEAKYNCQVLMFEGRIQLKVKRIGEMLKKMIPKLQLPPDYKLKRKPCYLQKSQRHRALTSTTASTKPPSPKLAPPSSSLTPPPSPPTTIPSSSASSASSASIAPTILIDDGKSIKHSLSHNELEKMNQFTLKIQPCDGMPEFMAAVEKLKGHKKCSVKISNRLDKIHTDDAVQNSTVIDLITDDNDQNDVSHGEIHTDAAGENSTMIDLITDENDQNDVSHSQVEYVEVEVVMDMDLNEDVSFKSLHYSSESTEANEFPEPVNRDTNDDQPNDESSTAANDADIHAIEQQPDHDTTDDIEQQPDDDLTQQTDDSELPSPPIEPIGSEAADDTPPLPPSNNNLEQSLLKCRNQVDFLKDKMENYFKPEMQRLNKIIEQNRSAMAQYVEDKIKMLAENDRLKKCLKKLQQQHSVEMQKAIEDTKLKQWCVNCKKEAKITQYELPVCSANCLLVFFEEKKKRAESVALLER